MLAGSGADGAPTNSTVNAIWFPSGEKSPAWKKLEALQMQPVRCGLIEIVHAPISLLGATGGRGNSTTSICSGSGGAGELPVKERAIAPVKTENVQRILRCSINISEFIDFSSTLGTRRQVLLLYCNPG
jgi:hypothetical protein